MWSFWPVDGRCGLLWVVVSRLRVVVGCCGPLWIVQCFFNVSVITAIYINLGNVFAEYVRFLFSRIREYCRELF